MAAMEAQMSQMQAQMEAQMRAQAEAQRQAEAAAAAKAAAKAEAAAAAAAAKAREDAMRRDWRAAPVANGAGEGGDAVATGGTIARNPYGGKRGGRASTPRPVSLGRRPGSATRPRRRRPRLSARRRRSVPTATSRRRFGGEGLRRFARGEGRRVDRHRRGTERVRERRRGSYDSIRLDALLKLQGDESLGHVAADGAMTVSNFSPRTANLMVSSPLFTDTPP